MTDVLNLDDLAPKPEEIIYKGKTILVNPLSVDNFVRAVQVGQKLETLKTADAEGAKPIIQETVDFIGDAIPDLKGEPLTMQQLLGLITLMMKLSTPEADSETAKELEKRGVEVSGGGETKSPKASTSPEQSQTT